MMNRESGQTTLLAALKEAHRDIARSDEIFPYHASSLMILNLFLACVLWTGEGALEAEGPARMAVLISDVQALTLISTGLLLLVLTAPQEHRAMILSFLLTGAALLLTFIAIDAWIIDPALNPFTWLFSPLSAEGHS